MKPIFSVAIVVLASIGFYAYKQQQRSFDELDRLISKGVNISAKIISRPLVAIDQSNRQLYLVYPDHTIAVPWRKIQSIKFIESRVNNKQDAQPTGPDQLNVFTTDGEKYTVTDMRSQAAKSYQQFLQIMPNTEITLKRRT